MFGDENTDMFKLDTDGGHQITKEDDCFALGILFYYLI